MRAALPILLLTAAAFAQTPPWKPLFDGKTLGQWKETPFTGHAAARVADGAIVLDAGAPLTGVTWQGAFPKIDYEVRFEAARMRGGDFFATLTFPFGDSFCTFVTGGWGGDIVGLSNIDGWDASENETRTYFTFETGKWYAFRIVVRADKITAYIDEGKIVDVNVGGRQIDLRFGDIKLSAPLGFASYATQGAIRKIEYRPLK